MKDCREIAPLLAGLAEDRGASDPPPEVAEHLAGCATCQHSLRVQRDVRSLLRARCETLQVRAPAALRARLDEQIGRPARRRWLPLRVPVAATLLLAILGSVLYGLTGTSSTVLAAQLALDHLTCAWLVSTGNTVDPTRAARDWEARYGWTAVIPPAPKARRASLTQVRKCLYGHGRLMHVVYEIDGRLVSLYVLPPGGDGPAGEVPHSHALLGQQAQVWERDGRTFALVADVGADQLARLAAEFRAAR